MHAEPPVRRLAAAARRRQGGEPHAGRRATRSRFGSVSFGSIAPGGGGRGGRGGGGGFGAAAPRTTKASISRSRSRSRPTANGRRSPATTRSRRAQAPAPLIWDDDERSARRSKAEKADRVIFTEQTFNEFPDYWVSNTAFASPRKVTDANPHHRRVRVGQQGAGRLHERERPEAAGHAHAAGELRAGQEVSDARVLLRDHVEHASQVLDAAVRRPAALRRRTRATAISCFQPDIVYEIGKPGSSALDCVTSAVKKVIELGYADPKHIGLQGHSWGGYQSSLHRHADGHVRGGRDRRAADESHQLLR